MKNLGRIFSLVAFLAALLIGIASSAAYFGVLGYFSGEQDQRVLPMTSEYFTPPSVDEKNASAFDPEGIYKPTSDSPIKGFSIENKVLDVDCDAYNFGDYMPPKLFVVTEDDSVLDADVLRIGGGKLEFETETSDATRFEFKGDFLIKGNFYTLDPKEQVVSGRLIQFVDGRKVSETELSFTWSLDLSCVC